ncbi:hypothetical protein B0H10DRAFT_1968464 [Mycena sp. CBHHK59/15]|nr:hypothetical protein B0H10DRAFT_1968464 [Mycena sp. CBHHK59/15]
MMSTGSRQQCHCGMERSAIWPCTEPRMLRPETDGGSAGHGLFGTHATRGIDSETDADAGHSKVEVVEVLLMFVRCVGMIPGLDLLPGTPTLEKGRELVVCALAVIDNGEGEVVVRKKATAGPEILGTWTGRPIRTVVFAFAGSKLHQFLRQFRNSTDSTDESASESFAFNTPSLHHGVQTSYLSVLLTPTSQS